MKNVDCGQVYTISSMKKTFKWLTVSKIKTNNHRIKELSRKEQFSWQINEKYDGTT